MNLLLKKWIRDSLVYIFSIGLWCMIFKKIKHYSVSKCQNKKRHSALRLGIVVIHKNEWYHQAFCWVGKIMQFPSTKKCVLDTAGWVRWWRKIKSKCHHQALLCIIACTSEPVPLWPLKKWRGDWPVLCRGALPAVLVCYWYGHPKSTSTYKVKTY